LPQVFLLHGQNSISLDERVVALKQELDPSGMGATTLDVSANPLDVVRSACHSAPFFGAGRLVVLTNVNLTTRKRTGRGGAPFEWSELLEVLETTPATTTVILRADENLPATSVIVKAAKKNKWTIESFPVPRGEELAQWVAERGHAAGVSISRAAAVQLLSRLYPTSWRQETRFDTTVLDTRLIATEVEKLACAAVDGVVSEETVRELVPDRGGYTAFKLNDLIYAGQSGPALQELEQVLASGDEPERVLAQMASEATGLEAARHVAEFDATTVSKASGVSEGRLRMLRQKPASRNPEALKGAIEQLRRAEWLVKTGRAPRSEAVIVATAAEVTEEFKRSRG